MKSYEFKPSQFDDRVTAVTFNQPIAIGELNAAIKEAMAGDTIHLVIDWQQVKTIDFRDLGELIGLKGALKKRSGDFISFNVNNDLAQQFNLIGLTNILSIIETEKEAAARFKWLLNFESETMYIKFPCSLDYVPGMRQLISQAATMRGFTKKDAYRVETIVDELCNNAIEHGASQMKAHITVRCSFDKEKLDLTIIDPGHGKMDEKHLQKLMERAKAATPESVSMRGRGLPIVSMLADKVNFSIEEGGTAVHVQKFKSSIENKIE